MVFTLDNLFYKQKHLNKVMYHKIQLQKNLLYINHFFQFHLNQINVYDY